MSNPDRLTGLDASFLALEKDGAHMHVGSSWSSRDRRPTTTRSPRGSRRGCTSSPATGSGWRSRRWVRRGPCGSTTRTSTSATTCATPRCRRPRARTSCTGSPGAFLAAARPREAAVGDLARRRARGRPLRADLQDPPRARRRDLGRGHHDRALRPGPGPARGRARAGVGRAAVPGACELLAAAVGERVAAPFGFVRGVLSAPDRAGVAARAECRRAGCDGFGGDRRRAAHRR